LGRPTTNAAGHIAFTAWIERDASPFPFLQQGIYLSSGGGLIHLIDVGDPAFGPNGSRVVAQVILNDRNQLAVEIQYDDDEGPSAVFLVSNGHVRGVAGHGIVPEGGVGLADAWAAALNSFGDIAFIGYRDGATGVYLMADDDIIRIADESDPAAGPESLLAFPTTPGLTLNDRRQVAFRAYRTSRPTRSITGAGVYMWEAGMLREVLRTGGMLDGNEISSSPNIFSFGGPFLNSLGEIALAADLADGSHHMFLASHGHARLVLSDGTTVPTLPRYVAAGFLGNGTSGAYLARTFPGGTAAFDERGTMRLREGQTTPLGGLISSFVEVSGAGTDHLAAVVRLTTGGVAVLLESGGQLTEVVRSGTLAPLANDPFLTFESLSSNTRGDVAFIARLSTNEQRVYLYSAGELRLIASGVPNQIRALSLNNATHVAIVRFEPGFGSSAIWVWSDGTFRALLRSGDALPDGGTVGHVVSLALNDAGELVFSNGSGVFLLRAGSIESVARAGDPAPGGGTLANLVWPDLNNNGGVVFSADRVVDGRTVATTLVTWSSAQLEEVTTLSDPANALRAVFTSQDDVLFSAAGSQPGVFIATRRGTPQAAINIETPNEPSEWGIGSRQTIGWTYEGNATHLDLEISRDGGVSWEPMAAVERTGPSQNFRWTVTGPSTSAGRIRVSDRDGGVADVNDAAIQISEAAITVIVPTAGGIVRRGARHQLFVGHNLGARTPVAVDVSTDGGRSWQTVVERARTRGATTSWLPWRADVPRTNRAAVRVRALDGSGAVGVSAPFRVRP
jgi:hypothetical protein